MLPLQPAVTSPLPRIPFTAVDGCSEWDAGRGRTGASSRRRQWVTLAEFGDRFLRNETRHRFEVISSLHYAQVYIQLQKKYVQFQRVPGYPFEINTGTWTALYHFSDTSTVTNKLEYHLCSLYCFF